MNNQDSPTTQAALKAFQSDYNIFFEKSIDVDGVIGPQTWGALFEVIREMIWIEAKKVVGETNPIITYGDGTGIHACGEQFAEDANTKKGRKSKKDRRVEICFMNPADPIEETPYTGPVVMEPILVKPIEKPAGKIDSITAHCKHTEKGLRQAFHGETLKIVPDAMGDKIQFKIKTAIPEAQIDWAGTCFKNNAPKGYSIEHSFSGIKSEMENWFINLITGIPPVVPQSAIKIAAFDRETNIRKFVNVQVFPRSDIAKVETGAKITGEIITKLGFSVGVAQKKLIAITCEVSSGINGEAKLFADKEMNDKNEKWNFQLQFKAEWNGLKGKVSWVVLNGKWEKDVSITIKEPVKLGEKTIELKPLTGADRT
jgi:hypothetical protein